MLRAGSQLCRASNQELDRSIAIIVWIYERIKLCAYLSVNLFICYMSVYLLGHGVLPSPFPTHFVIWIAFKHTVFKLQFITPGSLISINMQPVIQVLQSKRHPNTVLISFLIVRNVSCLAKITYQFCQLTFALLV